MDLRLRWSSCLIEALGAIPATSDLVSLTWTGYTGLTKTTPLVSIQCPPRGTSDRTGRPRTDRRPQPRQGARRSSSQQSPQPRPSRRPPAELYGSDGQRRPPRQARQRRQAASHPAPRARRRRHPFKVVIVLLLAWVVWLCLLYTSPSPRDQRGSRMPSSA